MATLYTNGEQIVLTPTQFNSYSAIRYSSTDLTSPVYLAFSAAGAVDFSARLGSVSAEVLGSMGADKIITGRGVDSLWGDGGNDSLYGGDGDDRLAGDWDDTTTIGNDLLYGGNGNDFLMGGLGADIMYGGDGDDRFFIEQSNTGTDTFYGGSGEDWIIVEDAFSFGVTEFAINKLAVGSTSSVEYFALNESWYSLTGTDGNDEINLSGTTGLTWTGSTYEDFLKIDLKLGADIYTGSAGRDYVTARGGDDKISLGAGDDVLTLTGAVQSGNAFLGGAGADRLEISAERAPDGGYGTMEFAGLVFNSQVSIEDFQCYAGIKILGTDVANTYDLRYLTSIWGIDLYDLRAGNDVFYGSVGDDKVDGGLGNDTFYGGSGDDGFVFRPPAEGSDVFYGGEGNDALIFRGGATIKGGAPVFSDIKILASQSFEYAKTLSNNPSRPVVVFGTDAANTFDFSVMTYSHYGELVHFNLLGGDDHYIAGAFGQWVEGGDGNDTLIGNDTGGILDGGAGADYMQGGSGSDTYVIDSILDVYVENPREDAFSVDAIRTSLATFTLAFGFDNLTAMGGGGLKGYGNAGNNQISGARGNDTLFGMEGADVLFGGAGADELSGGSGRATLDGGLGSDLCLGDSEDDDLRGGRGHDRLVAGGGSNRLEGGTGNDTLISEGGADYLSGGAGDDWLEAGAGDDSLYGGAGRDTLDGGAGDDIYFLDGGMDTITDSGKGDSDKVVVIGSFARLTGDIRVVEILNEQGAAVTGSALANRVYGGVGNDTIRGMRGDDTLVGGDGVNRLEGGDGDDIYVVTSTKDVLIEAEDGGYDVVRADFDFKPVIRTFHMGDNVEEISCRGGLNVIIVGNDGNNIFRGSASAEEFQGGGGNDTMYVGDSDTMKGGDGDDTYIFDGLAFTPTLFEEDDGGNDTIISAASYTRMAAHMETLKLVGSAWQGFGNDQANTISGRGGVFYLSGFGGDDTLIGAAGSDSLYGGTGADQLTGGKGADSFYLLEAGAVDVITDYEAAPDKIYLSRLAFQGFPPSKSYQEYMGAFLFKDIATDVVDADDRILYDSRSGELFHDRDGAGGEDAVLIAVLTNHPLLDASDFRLVDWSA